MKLNEPHVHHADELDPEFREALESTLSPATIRSRHRWNAWPARASHFTTRHEET
jgi:hypothetical protein